MAILNHPSESVRLRDCWMRKVQPMQMLDRPTRFDMATAIRFGPQEKGRLLVSESGNFTMSSRRSPGTPISSCTIVRTSYPHHCLP